MTDSVVGLTAEIVAAYVSNNSLPAGQVPEFIADVHSALTALVPPVAPKTRKLVPPVSRKKSVYHDYLISLEDGKKYKTLKRHLGSRGLTPQQYREKWDLPEDYPMVAASYSSRRSELATQFDLGSKPANVRRRLQTRAAKRSSKG
ncbi:MAG: MucR family transcriptional regulator [Planctomycetales bacterium]|nr:MucR family transcriptional regulator [Planctomycetales bacterium]